MISLRAVVAVIPSFLIIGVVSPDVPPAARRIVATCVNATRCAVEGTLVIRAVADPSRELRVPMTDGVAHFRGEAGGVYDVELQADGFWMPRQSLTGADTHTIRLWRTTSLRGRFAPENSTDELPKTFRVGIESPPGATGSLIPRDTTIDCPVGPGGEWHCAVPSATLDVVLRAKGFTPYYRWDVKLPLDEPVNLGTVVLKRGASMVAWLDKETMRALKEPARARLVRRVMADSSPIAQRLLQPVAEAAFNSRGVVQLAPVPAGTYTLEVSAPGFAEMRVDPIEIYERSESSLRHPIRLDPPLTIQLELVPKRDPTGAAWRIDVFRADPVTSKFSRVAQGEADEHGSFEIGNQGPGRYDVTINDARGSIYASRQLQIVSQENARHTIEMALSLLRGTISLGGRPLAATLLFGGSGGSEQIKVIADADGVFEVSLPRRGKWRVDVEADGDDVQAAAEVLVKEDQKEITIDLPDTEVAGWVIGPDGGRVAAAAVALQTTAGVVTRRAQRDGTFRFRGIASGAGKIGATDGQTGQHGRMIAVQLSEGKQLTDVELRLDASRQLTGFVISRGQPLVGARVIGYGYVGGGARQEKTISGLDGGFTLSFPEAASEVTLIVGAAGRTLQAFKVLASASPHRLEIAPVGGTLRLAMTRGSLRARVSYNNGVDIPLHDLMQWARAQNPARSANGALEIPSLAPGLYRFCASAPDTGQETCRDGTLPIGSVLDLNLK